MENNYMDISKNNLIIFYYYIDNSLNFSFIDTRSEERPTTSTGNSLFNNIDWNQDVDQQNQNMDNIFDLETQNIENKGLSRKVIFKCIKRMKIGRSSKECTICFNKFNKNELIRSLPCKHIFHEGCIIPWFTKNIKCPNCRMNLKEFYSNVNEGN